MMTRYAEKNTAITGIGQSEIYRKPQVLPFELAVRACELAIADTGLSPGDIDGVACWPNVPRGTVSGSGAAAISDIANTLNLNLNWRSVAGSPFDLALFATNVTNEKYYVAAANGLSTLGGEFLILGQPRIYGAWLKFNFGE